MRRAIGRLRLPGSPRLLDRDECLVVVSATAALSAAYDVSWRVAPDAPERDVPHLSESLARARRDGRVFLLPPGSRSWLDLRYAYPDTGYALALLLVWSYGASRHDGDEAGSGEHVDHADRHQTRNVEPPAQDQGVACGAVPQGARVADCQPGKEPAGQLGGRAVQAARRAGRGHDHAGPPEWCASRSIRRTASPISSTGTTASANARRANSAGSSENTTALPWPTA